DHVFVVDSRNLCNGIALLIMKAQRMIEAGDKTAAEIWLELQSLIPRVNSSFVLGTVTYLYRGGRCSAVSAFTANALNLKPKIAVQGGRMGVVAKYRGKQDFVIRKYTKDLKPLLAKADPEFVFICHSAGVPQALIDEAHRELEGMKRFEHIYETRAGGVISTHCGPGTFAIMFIDGE
ncbi:MAG: DegV family protein, partial [bacterium]